MANTISTYEVFQPAVNSSYNSNTGVVSLDLTSSTHEYILYDPTLSSVNAMKPGERVFQNTVHYPGGSATPATIAISAGNTTATVSGANLTAVFLQGDTPEYIVAVSNNHGGSGRMYTDVRRVVSVVSNAILIVDQPFTITNAAAFFMKTVVGEVVPTPREMRMASASLVDNTTSDKVLLVLRNSNANTSVRFVNNSIEGIGVSVSGTGYSNADYLVLRGFETVASLVLGGYPAYANIRTDASGNVTAIYPTNTGAGFPNSSFIAGANIVVVNSTSNNITSNTSAGSGLELSVNVGSTIKSEHYQRTFGTAIEHGGMFAATEVLDLKVTSILPDIQVQQPAGTVYDLSVAIPYYVSPNASPSVGFATRSMNAAGNAVFGILNRAINSIRPSWGTFPDSSTPVMPSRSNQMVIPDDATGAVSTVPPAAARVSVRQAAASDFSSVRVRAENSKLEFSRYLINNSYAGEHGNHGNALARHITTKLTFDRPAEDLKVFLSAYRPANTDIKVYARFHTSEDVEAFDDKDWTLLECTQGNDVFSSNTSRNDYREYAYDIPQFPNTDLLVSGTVTLEAGNTIVLGVGTALDNGVSGFETGDLVLAYDPLFPNTNHVVLAVDSVANGSQMTVHTAPTINASGYKAARIRTYSQQAFRNIQNDNVVRYYSTSLSEHDTYDTLQLKLVMLSEVDNLIPRIDDIRAIGVSV